MVTALDIITSAMRKSGIITKNEVPSSDEVVDGLEMLNDLMESWSNNSLMITSRTLENFSLTGGVSDYTIGDGGDFNTTRPISIISSYIRIGVTDYPLKMINDDAYANIAQKSIQSNIPDFINYNNNYALGKIKIYPTPSVNYSIFLLTEKPLITYSLSDNIDLPAGWKRALIYNLAMELAPEYGEQVTQSTLMIARESLANIKRSVAKKNTLDGVGGIDSLNNVLTGWTQ